MKFLSALLLLAPAVLASPLAAREQPPPPPTPPKKTCTARSGAITEWKLKKFDYHADYIFTTPAHQNSWGYISFNVTNPVLDFTVECSTASNRLSDFFYGDQIYNCPAPPGKVADTTFTFNRPTGELRINQTWFCHDDPQYPARFTALGWANAELKCKETKYQNEDWQIGEIYSSRDIDCDVITLKVPVKEIYAIA